MIQSGDLRIGNWVTVNGEPTIVEEVSSYSDWAHGGGINTTTDWGDSQMRCTPMRDVEGIPITPEILEAAGFEKYGDANWMWCIDLPEGRSLTVGKYDDYYKTNVNGATVRNLHQLQNLYFALTNSELPMTFENKI